jgi:hypothetical protein
MREAVGACIAVAERERAKDRDDPWLGPTASQVRLVPIKASVVVRGICRISGEQLLAV